MPVQYLGHLRLAVTGHPSTPREVVLMDLPWEIGLRVGSLQSVTAELPLAPLGPLQVVPLGAQSDHPPVLLHQAGIHWYGTVGCTRTARILARLRPEGVARRDQQFALLCVAGSCPCACGS